MAGAMVVPDQLVSWSDTMRSLRDSADIGNKCVSLGRSMQSHPTKVPTDAHSDALLDLLLQIDPLSGLPRPQTIISDTAFAGISGEDHRLVARRRRLFEAMQFVMTRYTRCFHFNTITATVLHCGDKNGRRSRFPQIDETLMKCTVASSERSGPELMCPNGSDALTPLNSVFATNHTQMTKLW